MATIYSYPRDIGDPPEWTAKKSVDVIKQEEDQWLEKLREWCKNRYSGEYVGVIIREQVADGYAQYMIVRLRPLELIHIPLIDGYMFQWAHKWNAKDVKEMVERERSLQKLFGPR